MIRGRDPAAMTESERLQEIAYLLAAGYQRFAANKCKAPTAPAAALPRIGQEAVDALAGVEAQWCAMSKARQEPA